MRAVSGNSHNPQQEPSALSGPARRSDLRIASPRAAVAFSGLALADSARKSFRWVSGQEKQPRAGFARDFISISRRLRDERHRPPADARNRGYKPRKRLPKERERLACSSLFH